MLSNRKKARNYLLETDRPDFLEIVYRAKVTPRQKQAILMKLLDKQDYGFIADTLFVSAEAIKKDLQQAYDLIYRYLLKTNRIPK